MKFQVFFYSQFYFKILLFKIYLFILFRLWLLTSPTRIRVISWAEFPLPSPGLCFWPSFMGA